MVFALTSHGNEDTYAPQEGIFSASIRTWFQSLAAMCNIWHDDNIFAITEQERK